MHTQELLTSLRKMIAMARHAPLTGHDYDGCDIDEAMSVVTRVESGIDKPIKGDDGGPVFPLTRIETVKNPVSGNVYEGPVEYSGMSVRQYFAAHAPDPPEWWSGKDWGNGMDMITSWRIHYADAMIAGMKEE